MGDNRHGSIHCYPCVCKGVYKSVIDDDENRNGDDENANDNVERGNDDDERATGDDENEGWNFDLMSATAYGCDLDERERDQTKTRQAGVLTRSKLETR